MTPPRVEFLCGVCCLAALWNAGAGENRPPIEASLRWDELPPLPNELGVAGAFAGLDASGRLIVAGGASFPRPVWETEKVWFAAGWALDLNAENPAWKKIGNLSRPLAYGMSVSVDGSIFCFGGCDAERVYDDIFRLEDTTKPVIGTLPEPRAFGSATRLGNSIYVFGGQRGLELESATATLWRFDWKGGSWETLPPLPAPGRAFHVAAAQNNGEETCLYVMSGRRETGGEVELLADVWEFSPKKNRWRVRRPVPRCVMAGAAAALGANHILVLGGDDGANWGRAEALKDAHQDFPKEALAYHALTDTWTSAGVMPANHITVTPVVRANTKGEQEILLPSGEVRPRVRSPKVQRATVTAPERTFGAANYATLGLYLAALVVMGFAISRKMHDTDDFFKAGGRIPWWAAGVSIFGTQLSAITFMAIPATTYAQDWTRFWGQLGIVAVAPFIVFFFFQSHPAELDLSLDKSDYIFPYYIVGELPAGVAGLVIAAVFAASMSSLDRRHETTNRRFRDCIPAADRRRLIENTPQTT